MARPRTCSVKYFCLGAFLIFLGSVLLCALGFTIVLPHEATRFWPEVACHVINASYDPNHCACDRHVMQYDNCIDTYPCLRIYVIFNISSDSIVELLDEDASNLTALRNKLDEYIDKNANIGNYDAKNAQADGYEHYYKSNKGKKIDDSDYYDNTMVHYHSNSHDVTKKDNEDMRTTINNGKISHGSNRSYNFDEDHDSYLKEHKTIILYGILYRRWSDSFHKTCTLYECGHELWNKKAVKTFQREWGQRGQSFPCFFNPEFPDVAVIERTSKAHAVHAMLWPALSLFTGSLIWLGMCLGCWKIETEQPQNSSTYYRGIL